MLRYFEQDQNDTIQPLEYNYVNSEEELEDSTLAEIDYELSYHRNDRNLKEGQEFLFPDDLFVHQEEDVKQLMVDSKTNYMVLSEMGTGKTPEMISIAELSGAKNVLIVCPKSIRLEWKRQIIQWTGVPPIVCHRGSSRRLNPLFESMKKGEENPSPYFIVNYETFRMKRYIEILELIPWNLIIMDEVHHLRNAETEQTKGMLRFLESQRKARVVVLSGSPIVNSPLDMYTLLMLLKPDTHDMKKRYEFLNYYTYWTPKPFGGAKVFGMIPGRQKEFQRYIEPFMIRRTKKDVLQNLPEKLKRLVVLDMEDDQKRLYRKVAEELVVSLDDEDTPIQGILALLTRLRQINLDPGILGIDVSSSKTEFLMELVEDGPSKLVVFSTFETYVNLVSKEFTQKGVEHIRLSGSVNPDKRFEEVQRFQQDPYCQVALGTIKTMGEGITLTAASDVVLMDRWWTPAANNQAIDRLHRPGQRNSVQVILPSNDQSIDQVLDEILKQKESITGAMLNEHNIVQEVLEDLRRMSYSWN